MNRKHLYITLTAITIFAIAMVFPGCKKTLIENQQLQQTTSTIVDTEGVVGKQLENPYSVINMQKALNNLLGVLYDSKYAINPSHYYIKIKPHSEEDVDLLKRDSLLDLYHYPLDYDYGDGFGKPKCVMTPEGVPESFYASIPVNYPFPKVDYEILEELYIPEEIGSKGLPSNISVDELVYEALRITNNLDEDYLKGRWTPAGNIKTWDTNKNSYVPLVHVEVRARCWFTTRTGITNSNGDYTCNGTLGGKANYDIKFERYDFEIRDGWLSTAIIDGPKKQGNWNYEISEDEHVFWATIFRAASHYYFDNIKNLRRPPQNSFWNTQLKIRAHNEENDEYNGYHSPALRFLGLGCAIHIFNPQHLSDKIYGTTIHELAHASHWNMSSGGSYTNCDDIVAESWARGVQWELTGMKYSGYTPDYFGVYTGVVQDMIDGINGYDQVAGYTIRQIEDALLGKKTWNEWKNNIKNKYNNETEYYLDGLFNHWLP